MIKFFRRIRQQLLGEGKTGKYLKYALGEILLVMIGILLALQVNNWNTNITNQKEEQLILRAFHQELVYNFSKIEEKKLWCEDIKSAIMELLEIDKLELDNYPKASIDTLIGRISWFTNTTIEMSVADAIIIGGKLSLMNNENLRFLITEWARNVDNVRDTEKQDYDAFKDFWMPYLQEHGYIAQISNSITKKPGVEERNYATIVPTKLNPLDHSVLLASREFHNILLRRLWIMDDIIYHNDLILPKLEKLIESISLELGE